MCPKQIRDSGGSVNGDDPIVADAGHPIRCNKLWSKPKPRLKSIKYVVRNNLVVIVVHNYLQT